MGINNISSFSSNITSNINERLANFTQSLPPEVAANFNLLIKIGQAIGGLIILYLIFLIIGFFINLFRAKRIKKMYKKVEEIDNKIDKLESKIDKLESTKKIKKIK